MIDGAPRKIIGINNIKIVYASGVVAVDGISFDIHEGEFVSLIGPSGCGKSTIANALAQFLDASIATINGKIELNAENIGYVFQRDTLLPWRTVVKNVETGLEIREYPQKEREQIAQRLLHAFGLEQFANAYPHQLSGGMRQRVSLARTLAYNPDVILMDEPFGALDAITRVLLQAEFLRISAEDRKTVLLITHDLAEAITMSDRIIVLSHRPARVLAEYIVDLADRKDPLTLRSNPRFMQIHAQIWNVLSAEVRQQDAA